MKDDRGKAKGQMRVTPSFRPPVFRTAALAAALALGACAGEPLPPGMVADGAGSTGPQASAPAPSVNPAEATIAFDPFTGAPGNIADALSRRIGAEARARNLRLVRRVGAPATYRVNGYLSASGDQSSTTLFYVFDVIDAQGNRAHRILGQEASAGAAGDPWAGIETETIDRAARRAVADLAAWLNR